MVIDRSAILAILFLEAEARVFAAALEGDPTRLVSAVSALEAALAVEARKGPAGGRELDLLLHRARIETVPFTGEQMEIARAAWRRYGRGQHAAGLDLADCAAYALSKTSGQPLLFKGRAFLRTDVANAALMAIEQRERPA